MTKKTLILSLAALAVPELFAIQGTISTEAESFAGDIKWHAREKKYIVEKGKITKEFKLADVTDVDVAKPAGFDKAVQLVQDGQGASAIGTLTKIVSDYRMLKWDKPAGRYLAMAHLAAGNAQKAYDACQAIVSEDKSAAYSGDLLAVAAEARQDRAAGGSAEEGLCRWRPPVVRRGPRDAWRHHRRGLQRQARRASPRAARRIPPRRPDVPRRLLRSRARGSVPEGGAVLRQARPVGPRRAAPRAGEGSVREKARSKR